MADLPMNREGGGLPTPQAMLGGILTQDLDLAPEGKVVEARVTCADPHNPILDCCHGHEGTLWATKQGGVQQASPVHPIWEKLEILNRSLCRQAF